MTRTLTLLFAVAGGAAVGNLYYVQPLLAVIATSLHVSSATAGLLVTATQSATRPASRRSSRSATSVTGAGWSR